MLVRSLEIQGFKTFPDKTVLQFHNGITAVVGPNGSGKSNISDAMRWVLGEQNVRTLRCTKMEDVIFNGTPQRKAQGYAEVTLNIDNSDRSLPFDKDEVAVTRRYYRSGESEYLLNKISVRLKDINELFMDTGLGRDGYSIIGQGKIDAIVSAKSEDRREIFEEAAGISRYRYRKEESERRLAAAEENLVRLNDILSELKDRVGPLKDQSEKAQKFLSYAAEQKNLQIALWLRQMEQAAKLLHTHDDKITLARTQQEAAEKELEELDRAAEQNFKDITGCAAQIDRVHQESSRKEEAAAQKDGQANVLDNDVQHGQAAVKRLTETLTSSAADRGRMREEAVQKEQQAAAHTQKEQEYLHSIDEYNQKLEDLRAQVSASSEQAGNLARQLSQLSSQATESRVAEMTAASAITEIGMRVSQADENIRGKEDLLKNLQKSKEDSAAMLSEMETRLASLKNTGQGYGMRLQEHRKKAEDQKKEADRLLLDAKESFRRVSLLESLERNLEGFHKSVKVVMQEAERGRISGVCGPVSRLITVPEAYTVALETALGASMQYVVVHTEQDAKNAIQLLKHRDAGRATFLPLNTIHGRTLQEPGLQSCPGFVGIASELCSSEETYREVRENLLGRIAVAKDLDAAVKIARRFHYRFRIVTLDGQVVNMGGSLTGGSLARNSGLLSRRSEIERICQKAKEQKTESEKASGVLKACLQEISKDEAALAAARGEYASAQEDYIRMKADREQLLKDLAGVTADVHTLHEEQNSSAQRMAHQKQLQETAQAEGKKIAAQIAQMQKEEAALTGSRSELDQKGQSCTARIQQLRLQLLSVQKDREGLQNALQELQTRLQQSDTRADSVKAELTAEKRQIVTLKTQAAAARKEAEDLRREAAEAGTEIEKINQHRMQLEQQSTQMRQKQKEKSSEKETVGHDLARLEERKANLQKQYDGMSAKLWEEYELTRREAEKQTAPLPEDEMSRAQRRLNELRGLIRALGSVNVSAIEEYKEVSQRYNFLSVQIEDVEKSRDELHRLIHELTNQMQEQFATRFSQINHNFTETFRELFGGGTASLELTDPENVLSSGIEITVQPPGKIVSHLESLSGGEKALVAIALYFAIMKVSPPPFCMLDEIEAALDDVNVTRFAAYLRRMSRNTQFIVITHRRGSMEEADVLYGVTMQDEGISKVLVLHPDEIEKLNAK
ncbi:MAG: chromosome segregation protein SMC [Oscillospiraceae bacterium]|nr:chromosome segregation protein SMC [Oscillospiraceae bacterium]